MALPQAQRRRVSGDMENVDGMNTAVSKRNGLLYPLIKKGYDCRTSLLPWINAFADFVEENATRFMSVLEEVQENTVNQR